MNDFPTAPAEKDSQDPADKKEKVIEMPNFTLPDKIRIKRPKEKE